MAIFLFHAMVVWIKCEQRLVYSIITLPHQSLKDKWPQTGLSFCFTKCYFVQICDMVTVARYLNLTMVIPELDKQSFWADPRCAVLSNAFLADYTKRREYWCKLCYTFQWFWGYFWCKSFHWFIERWSEDCQRTPAEVPWKSSSVNATNQLV